MRAHEPKKTARAKGAAGMHIKSRIWWLGGFPRHSKWISIPQSGSRGIEELPIDGTLIRRAAYGLRKLRGEFPRALGLVVDDAPRWIAGVAVVLEALKGVAHGSGKAPRNLLGRGLFSRALEKDIEALEKAQRAMADRLTWVYATNPRHLRRAVSWLANKRPQLDDPIEATQLAHLVVDHGESRVATLAALLSDQRTATIPVRGGPSAIEPAIGALGKVTQAAPLVFPRAELHGELRLLLAAIPALDAKSQRRVLAVLDACDLGELLDSWQEWWRGAEREVTRAVNIGRSHDELREVAKRAYSQRKKLLARKNAHPLPIDTASLRRSILNVSEDAKRTVAAVKLVESLPTEPGDRCAFIHHLGALCWPHSSRRVSRLPKIATEMAGFFRAVATNEAALAPWRKAVRSDIGFGRSWATTIEEDLLSPDFPAKSIGPAYKALTSLAPSCADKHFDDVAQRVASVFEVVANAERAEALVRALVVTNLHKRWISEDAIRGIDALGDTDSFAEMAPPLVRLKDEAAEVPLPRLLDALLDAVGGDRQLLRAVLTGGDLSLLIATGRRLAILRKLKARVDLAGKLDGKRPAWIARYPKDLTAALTLLARSTEDSETVAEKLLGGVIRSPDAVRREHEAISQRLDSKELNKKGRARLESRAANLKRRLAAPVEISAAKLGKLSLKITRRAARALLESALGAANRNIEMVFAKTFAIDEVPGWMLESRTLRAILAALELPSSIEVAMTLLRTRCGPRPWDLRTSKPNAAFTAKLVARGVNMTPWLDGLEERTIGTNNAEMVLRLEDDPIEVFYMGQHFDTCLSLGQCNFFSVFANAADINKRVLYARDKRGVVVGRRLFCISDAGALVAFRAYAHDHNSGFEEASTAFAGDLATAMGIPTAPRGNISTLVANDWYDDGSVDVANRFEFLTEGSDFRRELATIEPHELAGEVERQTGQHKVDAVLAPMLAALPELIARPALARPLLSLIPDPNSLPGETAVVFAILLEAAGSRELASATFADAIERYIETSHRAARWLPYEAISFLARTKPSRALGLLRRTRTRGIRSWADEPNIERAFVAARCLIGLRRKKQARDLLEVLLESWPSRWNEKVARSLLAELD